MGTVRSEQVFEEVIADLQRLYGVQALHIVCDAHPDYATTRWAMRRKLPVTQVLHHHAHASALAGEQGSDAPALVFVWDGVGFGADRTLWGGETFLGVPGEWRRVASLRPFRLPGGERAGRSPWRSAAALCWAIEREPPFVEIDALARRMWQQSLNCPETSAVGRLFDAAAALVLGVRETSYEGEGPMRLEAAAEAVESDLPCDSLPRYRDAAGLDRIDWQPLLMSLLDSTQSAARRARAVHETLAATLVAVAEEHRERSGINTVGLTGGVFQNRLLTTLARAQLEKRGFRVWLAEQVPCNDGGLSYGQLVEYASRSRLNQSVKA
jgi:hydrogenase maturation protein HypF